MSLIFLTSSLAAWTSVHAISQPGFDRDVRMGKASHSILWSCLYLFHQLFRSFRESASCSLDLLDEVPPLAEVLDQIDYTRTSNSQGCIVPSYLISFLSALRGILTHPCSILYSQSVGREFLDRLEIHDSRIVVICHQRSALFFGSTLTGEE